MPGTPTSRDGSEDSENNPEANSQTEQAVENGQSVVSKLTFEVADSQSCVDTSNHAELRWIQRAHEFEHRASQAWHRAERVLLDTREFDRVRYDEQTNTLLCVNGKKLITILSAEYETFAPINADEATTVRCVACGRQRNHSSDECSHCGSEFVADATYTVSTQEGR